jgi:hypothetical protein
MVRPKGARRKAEPVLKKTGVGWVEPAVVTAQLMGGGSARWNL